MGEKVVQYVEIQSPEFLTSVLDAIERNETPDQEAPPEQVIKLAMVSASRVKAYDRQDARVDLRRWLMRTMGRDPDAEEVDEEVANTELKDLPEDVGRQWMCMFQACDIVGALVPDQCVNWEAPEELEGWLDVEDYIFSPALERAWRLNPHWRLENQPPSKNAPRPESEDSNEDSKEASEPG